jgi:hypothetical protein
MLLITRRDLLEAIEKCQGQKNPNANTCIKLAAYYTILDHTPEEGPSTYSFSGPSSEFMNVAKKLDVNEVLMIMDGLMESLQGVAPKLYYDTMDKLEGAL